MNNVVSIESKRPKTFFDKEFYSYKKTSSFEEKFLSVGAIVAGSFPLVMSFCLFGAVPFAVVTSGTLLGVALGVAKYYIPEKSLSIFDKEILPEIITTEVIEFRKVA